MFVVYIKKSSKKFLNALSKSISKNLINKIKVLALSDNPEQVGIKLVGIEPKTFRLKVGNYRIIYRVDFITREIVIFKIGHRKDVYKALD